MTNFFLSVSNTNPELGSPEKDRREQIFLLQFGRKIGRDLLISPKESVTLLFPEGTLAFPA